MYKLSFLISLVLLCKSVQATHVAEGYFVVDSKALQIYINERTESDAGIRKQKALEEIQKDINYFLSEVNKVYLSLNKYGLAIEIRVRHLEFLDSDIFSNNILLGNRVEENQALKAFDNWTESTNAYKSLQYDFAALWTGYSLGGNTAGYSHLGAACSKVKANAVIEYSATYLVAETTAHEIAHLLGANHDGVTSSNIMSVVGRATDKNRWYFSSCSASQIKDYINSLSQNCLETTSSVSTKPSVTSNEYSGQLFNPDVICARALRNSTSYMCKNQNLYGNATPRGNIVCSSIYCHIPLMEGVCKLAFSSDGLICDVGKRCDKGVCQNDDSSQTRNVDPNCIWGDSKIIQFTKPKFTGNCSEFISQFGTSSCYDPNVYQVCCETCKNSSTKQSGCEYGDRNADCGKHSSRSICWSEINKETCCDYCKDHINKRSADNEQSIILSHALPDMKEKRRVPANEDKFAYDTVF